jgi:hypothetical protein
MIAITTSNSINVKAFFLLVWTAFISSTAQDHSVHRSPTGPCRQWQPTARLALKITGGGKDQNGRPIRPDPGVGPNIRLSHREVNRRNTA